MHYFHVYEIQIIQTTILTGHEKCSSFRYNFLMESWSNTGTSDQPNMNAFVSIAIPNFNSL